MEYILLFLFGLIIGSFLNVVGLRVPQGKDIVFKRSHCTRCERELLWYDMIPLLSFLLLRGRCRFCRSRISWHYPIVELVSGLLLVAAYVRYGSDFGTFVFVVIMLEIFLVLILTDIRYLILPNSIIATGIVVAIMYGLLGMTGVLSSMYTSSRIEHITSAFVYAGIVYAFWYFSRGRLIGLGDVKLMLLLGLLFGYAGTLIVIYGGIFIGTLVSVALLMVRRASLKTRLPLGAFLLMAAMVHMLYDLASLIPYYVMPSSLW